VAEFNGTDDLAKLSGGYLLGDWLKRAKKIANVSGDVDDLRPQKMLLYSAHVFLKFFWPFLFLLFFKGWNSACPSICYPRS
jgi:hypothetical protein